MSEFFVDMMMGGENTGDNGCDCNYCNCNSCNSCNMCNYCYCHCDGSCYESCGSNCYC